MSQQSLIYWKPGAFLGEVTLKEIQVQDTWPWAATTSMGRGIMSGNISELPTGTPFFVVGFDETDNAKQPLRFV